MLFSPPDQDSRGLRKFVEAWCGRGTVASPVIRSGGNSRIFRVETSTGSRFVRPGTYALKIYPQDSDDGRDRLGAEIGAIRFLRDSGVHDIPVAVASDAHAGAALFEWIDGEPVVAPSDADLAGVLNLMARLHALAATEGGKGLPAAAEATVSMRAICDQIDRRQEKLSQVREDSDLGGFLDSLTDVYGEVSAQATYAMRRLGQEPDDPVARRGWTLSPSDFGFHNTLRRPDGRLVFIDFEYFGWDSAARMVADFLLHPGMQLSGAQRRYLVERADSIFGEDQSFHPCLAAWYPLVALRWCLIVLKPFNDPMSSDVVRRERLGKAWALLERARKGLEASFESRVA